VALTAIETMLPEEDFTLERLEIASLAAERRGCGQAMMAVPALAGGVAPPVAAPADSSPACGFVDEASERMR
jgi:hypothetical protein